MKRSLFALLLIGILLLSFGCGKSPAPNPTEPDVTQSTPDEPAEATPDQPTESTPTNPAETEPEATIEATEPATTAPVPAETVNPTEATKPTEASKPSQNTKPVKPTKPAEPSQPTKPSQPTQPVKPTKPSEPTQPVKPTKPSEPTQPVKPTKPSEPTQPTTPTEAPKPTETTPSLSGWVEKDGKRYYYDSDGNVHTGWLSLDGDRYYFYEDGTMAVGKVKVPGSGTRYFTSTGKECILVNPWNYVPDDYSVQLSKYGDYKVAKVCLADLKDMIADCKSAGSKAVVVSAYRSHSYQAGLFERRIQRFIDQGYSREKAEIEAAKRVAVPGTSEHELGLAMDIVDVNYQNLDEKQEDTAAQKWLMANSWKYGFILRYPNSKSNVTGIIYEPWHYRYVGKELAKELHNSGLCLEEYFASLS